VFQEQTREQRKVPFEKREPQTYPPFPESNCMTENAYLAPDCRKTRISVCGRILNLGISTLNCPKIHRLKISVRPSPRGHDLEASKS
jgi:hypothetical protein